MTKDRIKQVFVDYSEALRRQHEAVNEAMAIYKNIKNGFYKKLIATGTRQF